MIDNLYDYTSQAYNKDGTSNSFMPDMGPHALKAQEQLAQDYLDEQEKKKQSFAQSYGIGGGSSGGGGGMLHQLGGQLAGSALTGGGGGMLSGLLAAI